MSKLLETSFIEEIKESYIDYSLSVLLSRALPDIRDGLKPVQRRILYAMYDMNLLPSSNFKKCAAIVGEVLGKYHPHGDSSVYEALVRIAQDFTLNYPLIIGQGNFGSIDGDPAAAYRYTEAKLSEIGLLMLKDIDLNTVDFRPNFDDTAMEPYVLPSALPNLLVNGSSGIAVGMTTNIPPHNLNEVIDACIYILDNPNSKVNDILNIIKGPDFPTGGIVFTSKIIKSIYSTGKGIIKVEGKYKLETIDKKNYIVIYEIPYSVNKAKLVKEIAELIKDKKLPDVVDVIDQSHKDEIRILLELRSSYDEKQIINYLKNFTSFRISFYCSFIAVDNQTPNQYNILQMLQLYLKHRREVVIRRTKELLEKNSKKAFLLKGLIKAIKNIDKVISIIKNSGNYQEATSNLCSTLQINHKQAEYILNLQLHRLTKLEINKLIEDYNKTIEKIKELSLIIDEEKKLIQLMKEEFLEIKKKYGRPRKTEIAQSDDFKEVKIKEEESSEDLILFSTSNGYLYSYKLSSKPEKIFSNVSNYNYVTSLIEANSKDKIIVFLSNGKVGLLSLSKLVDSSIFLPKFYKTEDKVKAVYLSKIKIKSPKLIVITKKGLGKLIDTKELKDLSRITTYVKLSEDDEVVNVIPMDNLLIGFTQKGYVFKVNVSEIPEYSKSSKGVKIVNIKEDDNIFLATSINENIENYILVLVNNNHLKINSKSIELVKRGKVLTEKNRILPKNFKFRFSPNTSFGIFTSNKSKVNLIIKEKEIILEKELKEELGDIVSINYIEGDV